MAWRAGVMPSFICLGGCSKGVQMTTRDAFLKLYRGYSRVLQAFAILAGVSAFAIMWIIDINALSRKILNAPLPAGVELTQSLLPVVIMIPFGYAMLRRDHVNTVLLTSRLPPRVARMIETVWMLLGFVLFALVTYGTFKYALRAYSLNEQVWGAAFRFPVWPAKMAVSFGTMLLAIQCLLEVIHGILFKDDKAIREILANHAEEYTHA
jgi:TRAP-type C4-dicarboxylate transport system permease small subunit